MELIFIFAIGVAVYVGYQAFFKKSESDVESTVAPAPTFPVKEEVEVVATPAPTVEKAKPVKRAPAKKPVAKKPVAKRAPAKKTAKPKKAAK